jgi:hypothetical protein
MVRPSESLSRRQTGAQRKGVGERCCSGGSRPGNEIDSDPCRSVAGQAHDQRPVWAQGGGERTRSEIAAKTGESVSDASERHIAASQDKWQGRIAAVSAFMRTHGRYPSPLSWTICYRRRRADRPEALYERRIAVRRALQLLYGWITLAIIPGVFTAIVTLPGGGTGNGPMISLRPSLITEHHSVPSLNDPAREALPCSRYLRPACDVDTTCTVRGNVHESMATKVRAHRAPSLLSGCVGRSDRSALRWLKGMVCVLPRWQNLPGFRRICHTTIGQGSAVCAMRGRGNGHAE